MVFDFLKKRQEKAGPISEQESINIPPIHSYNIGRHTTKKSPAAKKNKGESPSPYIASLVSSARTKLKLSRRSFGLLFGVSDVTVFNWEKGRSWPSQLVIQVCQKVQNTKIEDDALDNLLHLTKTGYAAAGLFLVLYSAYGTEGMDCP